jgi:D-glycero-D-manno-heptose 1,7-bisphosphate phosphatase
LLERLAKHYGVSMRGVPVVGDSCRDLEAALAVDARPILVLTGNGKATQRDLADRRIVVETYDDLRQAARALIAERERSALPSPDLRPDRLRERR